MEWTYGRNDTEDVCFAQLIRIIVSLSIGLIDSHGQSSRLPFGVDLNVKEGECKVIVKRRERERGKKKRENE
jgi:hypothetical protein